MRSEGKPNVCNEKWSAPSGRCGYTESFASAYCGSEAVYEAASSRGRHFLVCADHAIDVRLHPDAPGNLIQLRLLATAGRPS